MPKKTVGFRFSEETLQRLAEISQGLRLTRTETLEKLIREWRPNPLYEPCPAVLVLDEPTKLQRKIPKPKWKNQT